MGWCNPLPRRHNRPCWKVLQGWQEKYLVCCDGQGRWGCCGLLHWAMGVSWTKEIWPNVLYGCIVKLPYWIYGNIICYSGHINLSVFLKLAILVHCIVNTYQKSTFRTILLNVKMDVNERLTSSVHPHVVSLNWIKKKPSLLLHFIFLSTLLLAKQTQQYLVLF